MFRDGIKISDRAQVVLGCALCGKAVAFGQKHTCNIQPTETTTEALIPATAQEKT